MLTCKADVFPATVLLGSAENNVFKPEREVDFSDVKTFVLLLTSKFPGQNMTREYTCDTATGNW